MTIAQAIISGQQRTSRSQPPTQHEPATERYPLAVLLQRNPAEA